MSTWNEISRQEIENPTLGDRTVIEYEGLKSELETFRATELPAGWTEIAVRKHLDDWAHLSATYPTTSEDPNEEGLIQRVWTLEANEIESSIFDHPNTRILAERDYSWPARIQAYVDAWRAACRTAVSNAVKAGTVATEPSLPDIPYSANATEEERTLADQLAGILFRIENPTWPTDQYVLQKTDLVVSSAQISASHANKGRILTYPTLLATEQTLAAALLIDAAGLSSLYWLKKAPTVRLASQGNSEIAQEYWGLVAWEPYLYGDAI